MFNPRGSREGNEHTHGQTPPTPRTTAGNGLQSHDAACATPEDATPASTSQSLYSPTAASRGQQVDDVCNTFLDSTRPPQSDSSSMTESPRDKFDQECALKQDSLQVTVNNGTISCLHERNQTAAAPICTPLPGEQPPQHDVVEKCTGDGCSGNVDTTNDERAELNHSHEEALPTEHVILEPDGTDQADGATASPAVTFDETV